MAVKKEKVKKVKEVKKELKEITDDFTHTGMQPIVDKINEIIKKITK